MMFTLGIVLFALVHSSLGKPVDENEPNETRFILLGDWGSGSDSQLLMAQAMADYAAENPVDFIMTAGDNFYSDGLTGVDDPRIDLYWRLIYNQASLINMPWQIVLGNHDYYPTDSRNERNSLLLAAVEPRWNLPHYWYEKVLDTPQGQVQMVMIDTQGLRNRANEHMTQLAWIDEILMNSTAPYSIVVGHHPPYTAGRHGPGSGTIQDFIVPILEINDVDILLLGHDHNLQHITYQDGSRLEYVVSGGGGASLYAQDPIATAILQDIGLSIDAFLSENGYVVVRINTSGFHYEFYNLLGKVYEFTRQAVPKPKRMQRRMAKYGRH